jgi:hypothetical protein
VIGRAGRIDEGIGTLDATLALLQGQLGELTRLVGGKFRLHTQGEQGGCPLDALDDPTFDPGSHKGSPPEEQTFTLPLDLKIKNPRMCAGFSASGTLLQSNNLDLYGCFDVSVQLNNNFVLTGVTQNVAHADFALGNGYAGSSDGFSHVTGTDGTEQLAFVARLGGDDNGSQLTQLGSALFGSSLVGSQFGFQLSARRAPKASMLALVAITALPCGIR